MRIEFSPKHDIRHIDSNTIGYQYKKQDAFYTKRLLKINTKDELPLF